MPGYKKTTVFYIPVREARTGAAAVSFAFVP